mgnify:CR=1 FL=1
MTLRHRRQLASGRPVRASLFTWRELLRFCSSGAMPGPVSATVNTTWVSWLITMEVRLCSLLTSLIRFVTIIVVMGSRPVVGSSYIMIEGLSAIARATIDGELLRDEYLDGSWLLIVFAGNDTTRNSISGSMKLLTEFPDQKRALQADLSLLPNAVDELIRMADRIHARVVGIEVTSLHEFITYPLMNELARRGSHLQVVELAARAVSARLASPMKSARKRLAGRS